MNHKTRISARAVWISLLALGFFAASATAQTYEFVHAFRSDGTYPYAGLIQATDGNLLGTTFSGGTGG